MDLPQYNDKALLMFVSFEHVGVQSLQPLTDSSGHVTGNILPHPAQLRCEITRGFLNAEDDEEMAHA